MQLTDYHAKYFAHELTKRCSSDSVGKLAASLADAQVDLNPHQIDAALFAFRSPLSKGAILADEVGLGKTIEAGILLSQKWAVLHPLAQKVIVRCRDIELSPKTLHFQYTGAEKRISILDGLVGKSGWLTCELLTIEAFEAQDHILFAGCTDAGVPLTEDQCRRFFSLTADTEHLSDSVPSLLAEALSTSLAVEKEYIIAALNLRNNEFFDAELDKLDRWGEDRRESLKVRLRELEDAIKVIKRNARVAPDLPFKLKLERERRNLETKREEAWKEYEEAARDIEKRKDSLIDEVEKKLSQHLSQTKLFSIHWRVM